MKDEERGKREEELFVVGSCKTPLLMGRACMGKEECIIVETHEEDHPGAAPRAWGEVKGNDKHLEVVIHTAAHLPTPARPPPRMEREAHLRAGGGMRPGNHGRETAEPEFYLQEMLLWDRGGQSAAD